MTLPTVLLRHQLPDSVHFDWLLANPDDPEGLLWTGRVSTDSADWSRTGQWTIHQIAPHRRVYLTYQGPIADAPRDPASAPTTFRHQNTNKDEDRGSVTRVDEGWFLANAWSAVHIELQLNFRHCKGLVTM